MTSLEHVRAPSEQAQALAQALNSATGISATARGFATTTLPPVGAFEKAGQAELLQLVEIVVNAGAGVAAQQMLEAAVRWIREQRNRGEPNTATRVAILGPDGRVMKTVTVPEDDFATPRPVE